MVFLKLVHTEYQVNHKTQPFWVKVVNLVTNVQTSLAGHDVGIIRLAPTTTLHFNTVHKTKYLFSNWIFLFLDKIRLEIDNIWCSVSVESACLNINEGVKMGGASCQKIQKIKNMFRAFHKLRMYFLEFFDHVRP